MPFSKRRNTRRAAVGSVLFLAGLLCGTLVAIPKLHRVMLSEQVPVDLTCAELMQRGISESSVVRLTDATIVEPTDELEFAMLEPDPNATQTLPVGSGMRAWMSGDKVALAKSTIADALKHPRSKKMMDQLVRGEVVPRGFIGDSVPQPLKLTPGREIAAHALDEVKATGTLTAFVTEDPTSQWIVQSAELLDLTLPTPFLKSAELDQYSLHPISLTESKTNAGIWIGASVLAMTTGWLFCSSAGWGLWILFCPIAAIVGVFGLPLRSGRGNRVTWMLAIFAGASCLVAAYGLAFVLGGLGQTQSTWAWQAAGFIAACAGLALWLGVRGSVKTKRSLALSPRSLDELIAPEKGRAKTKAKRKRASKANQGEEEQYATTGVRQDKLKETLDKNASYSRKYLDPRLSVPANAVASPEATEHNLQWQKSDFEEPLLVEIGRGDAACSVTIQVGCQSLVLAMTDEVEGEVRLRMVSVLDDGHCLVSVDDSYPDLQASGSNDQATLSVFESVSAQKLLANHLEQSANVAEQRHARLVTLDSNEWRDVVLLSERVLKSILHDEGHQKWDICDMTYGRFTYPAQPVRIYQEV
ncbi:MFS transporter [Rhodopirellula sp. P2]|uniref:MFS transporter n=1 Tax=Rhodopirellula sp. P2 TaxID=2127060 RepID=UPI00236801C5|nr:MFS transporter [Rhodopirellula sp. P2]WDQ15545.1 MFS transporter [Rhodopirellula sp. P2]